MKPAVFITYCTAVYLATITAQRTSLENFMPKFRLLRKILNQIIDNDIRSKSYTRDLAVLNKTQTVVGDSIPFPCSTNEFKSREKPGSVDLLRPGDIDVIGAIGDSLTAGIGALSTNLVNLNREYRGVTFPIGGQKTWREYLTIPNILKEFNPNLVGYALGTSTTLDYASQFNVAEGFSMTGDIYYMTKILIKRITSDRRVNVNNDWKMISIFIGANDFCEACYEKNPEDILRQHKDSLMKTLRLIREKLPRTFVNLISPPHVHILGEITNKPNACEVVHRFSCPCFVGETFKRGQAKLIDIIKRWQLLEEEIANYDEFNQDNFTVVWQPLFVQPLLPRKSNGEADLSYFGADCFHFSQKGHALVANALWSNIMSPVGGKGTTLFPGDFKCPTMENPYLFTRRNSNVRIKR